MFTRERSRKSLACCNVTHAYTSNSRSANILVNVQRLDGPSGVLADMQLPVGNVDQSSQLLGRIDDSEVWGVFDNPPPNKIDLYRVVLHELLHAHMAWGTSRITSPGVALISANVLAIGGTLATAGCCRVGATVWRTEKAIARQ
jgi:hypothetical protein